MFKGKPTSSAGENDVLRDPKARSAPAPLHYPGERSGGQSTIDVCRTIRPQPRGGVLDHSGRLTAYPLGTMRIIIIMN
jgi:hypothetical protein